jgi:phenylacetate-coenzyme A ligase PaaK-like adenylate-forming protein
MKTREQMAALLPDPLRMEHVLKLFTEPPVFGGGPEIPALFMTALREMVDFHIRNNPFYASYLSYHGFDPASLKEPEDMIALPFFHANFFKTHVLRSVPEEKVARHYTSSGTTGQKSQVFFDEWSFNLMEYMVGRTMEARGLITGEPVNNLLFGYEPYEHSTIGTAMSTVLLSTFAPGRKTFFALRQAGNGKHEFDIYGAIRVLKEYSEEEIPVRTFGFPAFFHFTLQRMKDLGMKPLKLHPDSVAMFGGGWKGFADRQIPKPEFYAEIEDFLGIPAGRCVDSFGSVEHFVPYMECPDHRFHLPVWSEVIIRDVRTLAPLGYEKPGFLNFISPYVSCTPANSLMLGDLGMLHAPGSCGCGIGRPWFEVLGRAGTSKNKSCAIAAAELLRR